jgi:hypothetical protein
LTFSLRGCIVRWEARFSSTRFPYIARRGIKAILPSARQICLMGAGAGQFVDVNVFFFVGLAVLYES